MKLKTKSRYDKVFYLATPYTHLDPSVKKHRADVAMKAAVDLLRHGVYVFSPIAYNAPMEQHDLPSDWEFWEDYDKAFVRRCDALLVLKMDGWDRSVGVQAEIDYAREISMPVFYITEEDIEIGRVDFLFSDEMRAPLFDSNDKL